MLDLISLAAKNPLVKAFFCVCLCVCMCARACCSGCFLLAFLTGSWCGVQLRTGKRPFLSTVNHLRERERERKKWKKSGEGKKETRLLHWFSPLQSGLPLFLSLSLHSLYLSVYLSFFFVCVCGVFLIPDEQQCSGGTQGFMESSQVLWEDWVRGLLCG